MKKEFILTKEEIHDYFKNNEDEVITALKLVYEEDVDTEIHNALTSNRQDALLKCSDFRRYEIGQVIGDLLPKMEKDEIRDLYRMLCNVAKRLNEDGEL